MHWRSRLISVQSHQHRIAGGPPSNPNNHARHSKNRSTHLFRDGENHHSLTVSHMSISLTKPTESTTAAPMTRKRFPSSEPSVRHLTVRCGSKQVHKRETVPDATTRGTAGAPWNFCTRSGHGWDFTLGISRAPLCENSSGVTWTTTGALAHVEPCQTQLCFCSAGARNSISSDVLEPQEVLASSNSSLRFTRRGPFSDC